MRHLIAVFATLVLSSFTRTQNPCTRIELEISPQNLFYQVGEVVDVSCKTCDGCGPCVIRFIPTTILPILDQFSTCPSPLGTVGPCSYITSPRAVTASSPLKFVIPLSARGTLTYVQSIGLGAGLVPCLELSEIRSLAVL